MIITAISTMTDAKTETVMIASVTLREVRIAQTQAAAVPVISKTRQKQPEKTQASIKRGTQQVQETSTSGQPNPQNESGLYKLFGKQRGRVK